MTDFTTLVHAATGLIVLAEAHRRLWAAQVSNPALSRRQRGLQALHVVAWLLLAFPALVAVFAPLISVAGPPICWRGLSIDMVTPPSTTDTLIMTGFAVLVVRDWLGRSCTQ